MEFRAHCQDGEGEAAKKRQVQQQVQVRSGREVESIWGAEKREALLPSTTLPCTTIYDVARFCGAIRCDCMKLRHVMQRNGLPLLSRKSKQVEPEVAKVVLVQCWAQVCEIAMHGARGGHHGGHHGGTMGVEIRSPGPETPSHWVRA